MAITWLLVVLFVYVASSHERTDQDRTYMIKIEGVRDHGFNTFNGQKQFDLDIFAKMFGNFPAFSSIATLPADYEDGDTTESAYPTELTDRNELLATIPSHPNTNVPPSYFSIPVTSVGTLDSISENIADRLPVSSFKEAKDIGAGNRRSKYALNNPTLDDFEQIEGRLSIECDEYLILNRLQFNIRNGIPMSVYTIWELNVFDAFTEDEVIDGFAPVLPNIFVTDKSGNGNIQFDLPYCPYNSCMVKSECDDDDSCPDCVLAYSLAIHWDYAAYGGTSALEKTNPALPGGIITSTQMVFYVHSKAEKL